MGHKFLGFLVGCLQLVFAAIVAGLSIAAVRWQYRGDVPGLNGYVCFAGIFGIIAALVGFMALLIDALAGVVMIIAHLLTALFMLCGGIAYAVGLSGVDCGNPDAQGTWFNKLINGGCLWNDDDEL